MSSTKLSPCPHDTKPKSKRGFSLVELSIVLVILGLLVGGVLAGQSLIRAAQLRAVTTEYSNYITAVNNFKDRYFALPGDMTNASNFWGALDGNDGIASDCRGESTSLLTCNGNGDGQICPDAACSAETYESYLFWKHLANAGLIEGSYTGNSAFAVGNTKCIGTALTQAQGGCNVPASKIPSGIWLANYMGTQTAAQYLFDGNYGNVLQLAAGPTTGGLISYVLSPRELWNIDTKIDDGNPATGFLVASRWNVCATGAVSTADIAHAAYSLANMSWSPLGDNLSCVPVFRNQF